FTQTEYMSLNTRQTMRNNNVLVIGGSGSGKTRFVLKPNLMQMHSSYIITDPKGTVLLEVGKMLEDNGYKIKIFNTVDFKKSMHYNPFGFIKDEKDILVFVDLLMTSTSKKGTTAADPFWENAEKMLYMALIGYMFYELPEEERNFAELVSMVNAMEIHEDDETFMNLVDYLFEEIELGTKAFYEKYGLEKDDHYRDNENVKARPNHFALSQYKKFKLAAGKTAKSILISAGVRLSPFDVAEVRELTRYDEMELSTVGTYKTALFIIIDDKIPTFNFLAAIMYSQLFKELCDMADNVYGGRLPVHVRCLLDEFANIGQIPNFDKLIATIRSREISVNVILQNMAQLEALYDKSAGTIVGNCDSTLFLGSGEEKTMESISKRVGKTTIDHRGTSETKGMQGSYSLQDQILGRELITADEVGRLDNKECILFIRGLKPFKSRKYDLTKHPNYKLTADSSQDNYFDINEFMEKYQAQRIQDKIDDENDKEFYSHLMNPTNDLSA
ncbi:MAG: type IV secretory system conjugative DNA transfer family protein, partial [Firmicutes bacterium]|nr:type IV secretory system conjugative DNA transfer family protein [Bacillota bacterium]